MTASRRISIETGSRLHCGLSSLGHGAGRHFGGVGMMVDAHGTRIELAAAQRFAVEGNHAERVERIARHAADAMQLAALPNCRVKVLAAPPQHVGLGTGTQLSLAVAEGLAAWCRIRAADATQLAQWAGRGRRSAIGTHGFLQGGLLWDEGKLENEQLGRLRFRTELPTEWRFVLITCGTAPGLAGRQENLAIDSLPPVSEATQTKLHRLAEMMFAAAGRSDFAEFSTALFEYGYRAGECFAAAQGGPYASPEIAAVVEWFRAAGVEGVGQSSWGPMVFALTASEDAAETLVATLGRQADFRDRPMTIAAARNQGAVIK